MDYPQVALDFMNRDHAEFIKLREALLALLDRQGNTAELDALLDRLLEHTRSHFAEEERLMRESGFPPYPMHQNEHEQVLQDMSDRIAHWQRQRDTAALRSWLDVALADWFVSHVGSMDFVTARFIKAQGKA